MAPPRIINVSITVDPMGKEDMKSSSLISSSQLVRLSRFK